MEWFRFTLQVHFTGFLFLEVELFSWYAAESNDQAVHRDVVPHFANKGDQLGAAVACKDHSDGLLNACLMMTGSRTRPRPVHTGDITQHERTRTIHNRTSQ